ncbi:glycoside hydrolase family 2 protein [Paenibacillus humicola]|uniref:glycoside hydrolase family 2 protein n=1 Tax=Paenibacillus humicola TaxID=3110540 RepID=UPI00237A22E7|nr:sugar-binding domain-containing protein [Paenibacillus humicola]
MTVQRISLNGSDWLLKDFVGEDWIWRNSEKPDTRDVRWWRPGTVPGTVLHDLWVNGEVPDPYFERNSLLVEWVPQRTWLYRKTFSVPESLRGRRVKLQFKGVDYAAQFFLNGVKLGEHEGMYTPAEFEVADLLLYGGDNLLAVVIGKAPDEQPQVSKTEYVRTHKSRMTYGWDFCPRMIHQGIWDDVCLDVTGPAAIEDVYVRPELRDDFSAARLSVSAAVSSPERVWAQVKTVIRFGGCDIASHEAAYTLEPGMNRLNAAVTLDRPKLWQPNGSGSGAPHLYEAIVNVSVPDETEPSRGLSLSASRTTAFGIRKVEFMRNDTPDLEARPYTLVVNGRKTYIKGWNWVPIDVMYGVERPAKLERLLQLAKRAGVNMLRVWGGGLIEKDAFYELCDRYGIMLWQEFIQSSSGIANKPSEKPEFLAMMEGEARQIVPRRRNHPSLVIWCGGNELQDKDEAPLDDREPVLGILRRVAEELHPDALWLPTSPSGRLFLNSLDNIERDPDGLHDVHGPWEHQGLQGQYELYNRGTSLLQSEFGVEGMTNLKTLRRTISAANEWPASKDNPVYFHRGAWWNNEPLVTASFGGEIRGLAQLIRASQFLQAEGLRYAVESHLRRRWRNSGTLPWQFNEPFPNAYCTSALDYFAMPKPAYYAVARAYRPVTATASFAAQAWAGREVFAAELWAASSLGRILEGVRAQWTIAGASGRVYASGSTPAANVPADSSVRLAHIERPLSHIGEELFFLDLELFGTDGERMADNRYLFTAAGNLAPMLHMPEAAVEVSMTEAKPEGNGEIACKRSEIAGKRSDIAECRSDETAGTESLVNGSGEAAEAAAAARDSACAQIEIVNTGDCAALLLHLERAGEPDAAGCVYFLDNDFTLLPGEKRVIAAEWRDVPEGLRQVELSGWNIALQTVSC